MSIQVNEFYHIPGKNDAEYIKLLKEHLEAQKQLIFKAIAKIKELSKSAKSNSSESPNNWIPININPPEGGKEYLIQTDTGYMCTCRWTNVNHFWTDLTTDWHWHIMDIPQYSNVVAWMPLPEPYQEVEE